MSFYHKENIREKKVFDTFHRQKIKAFNEFLFFVYLLLEIAQIGNKKGISAEYIYLLNFVFVKYILLFKKVNTVFYDRTICFLAKDITCYLRIFFDSEKNGDSFKIDRNCKQIVLLCKRVARTRKKGRVCRYKVILLSYSTSSRWFGIGEAKDFFLHNAIAKARLKSLFNIYSFVSKNSVCYLNNSSEKGYRAISMNESK